MRSVLITGGAGFIGSHLCTKLLNDLNIQHVVALDNLLLGTEANVAHLTSDNRFRLRIGDVNEAEVVNGLFEEYKFDTVFHLAANSDISISHSNPDIDFTYTFKTTWSVLEALRKYGCKKLIFASTSAIYGDVTENIHENFAPLHPISHYGAGKLASEAFISSFSYNYDIQTYIFRFPNVVGSRSTHGVIYDFVNKLKNNKQKLVVLGNGQQEKSYLHVSDLIQAILHCMDLSKDKYNVFNVGGIDTINVARIAALVIEETKGNQSIEYTGGERGWLGDVPKFKYNIEKILSTGWLPVYNSEMAVRRTIKELINN